MAFAKRKQIGRTSNFFSLVVIAGKSIALGDDVNSIGSGATVASRQTTGTRIGVGWNENISKLRVHPYFRIPLQGVVPAMSRVFRATLNVCIADEGSWPANVVAAGVKMTAYGIRRPGLDETTFNFQIYKTGSNWDEFAGKVGTDLTSAALGEFTFTQADRDTLAAGGSNPPPLFKAVDVTNEIAYRVERNEDARIMFHSWLTANGSNDEFFELRNPNDASNQTLPNTYLDIEYVPPIVFHGVKSSSGRPIDLSNVLDAESFESQHHVYGGFIDLGEDGEVFKFALRNTRLERIARRIVIEATRSMANKPTPKPANTGTAVLRSVDCFNLTTDIGGAVTKLTPRGKWELRFVSATHFDVYFDNGFTGAYSLVIANRAIAVDNTIQFGGVDAIRIRAAKWSGVPANLDKINFETVSDTTSTSYPTDSKDMMFLIPPVTQPDGDGADTAKKRSIKGYTQQTRASSYVVSDGGQDRTVVPLLDAELAGFTAGQKAVIVSGTQSQEVTIRQVYNTAAALPAGAPPGAGAGDAVMLEEETDQSYAAGSFFTTGLYVSQLEKSDDTFVGAAGAASGQNVIPVSPAVNWEINDEFTAIKLSTGQVQDLVVQANNTASITASTNLTFSLAAGDLLVKKVDGNWASFFFQGSVPEGASLGDRLAILRAYEMRASLKNIV